MSEGEVYGYLICPHCVDGEHTECLVLVTDEDDELEPCECTCRPYAHHGAHEDAPSGP